MLPPNGTLVVPPDKCCDTPNERVIDLRPEGISCIPALEHLKRKNMSTTTSVEHVHDGCVEIVFCQRGKLAFESMGTTYLFRPGMVFISRPDEPHRLSAFPRGMLMYCIMFLVGKRGTSVLGLSPRESDCLRDALLSFPKRLFAGGDDVRLSFQRVFRIYDTEKSGSPWRLMRLRMAILELLFVLIDAASVSDDRTSSGLLANLVAEIRANPVATITLDDLAARTHLSPNHLSRQFKRLTGLPPLAFRNSCRIDQAKRELATTGRTIGSIAIRLGYSSTQNFTTSFRLATGQTPRAWREKCLRSVQSDY